MADSPEIRAGIGKALYLERLEPRVFQDVRELRETADHAAKAIEAYTDRTVEHAPEDWRHDVRTMIETAIKQSRN